MSKNAVLQQWSKCIKYCRTYHTWESEQCVSDLATEVERLQAENEKLTADWAREHTALEFGARDVALGEDNPL